MISAIELCFLHRSPARCADAVNVIPEAIADACHLDLAMVTLSKVATPVLASEVVLSTRVVKLFAAIALKIGALKGAKR